MTHFFTMSHNTHLSRGWTYAPSIYPETEPFVDEECGKCGSIARYPLGEFSMDVEDGSKYPDFMFCGAYPLLIVSEKVINDWIKDNLTGFSYYSVQIKNVKSKRLKTVNPPKYYHIVVKGRCELDLEKMDVEIIEKCPVCGNLIFSKPTWEIDKLIIKEKTWDGSDLFISDIFPRVNLVTERVAISAYKNNHTNVRFLHLDDYKNPFANAVNLKKLYQMSNS